MDGEWIEWGGDGTPKLNPETMVFVRCRDGYESTTPEPFEAYDDSGESMGTRTPRFWKSWWVHHGDGDDIISYRVVAK